MKTTAMEKKTQSNDSTNETVIQFNEGLVGFSDCKTFMLMEGENIAPFRLLQSVERGDFSFLVLDPTVVMKNYYEMIPSREWESLGVNDPSGKLAFTICTIGATAADSSANFQAPILVDCKKMVGRQVILSEAGLSVRQPLL